MYCQKLNLIRSIEVEKKHVKPKLFADFFPDKKNSNLKTAKINNKNGQAKNLTIKSHKMVLPRGHS